MKIRILAKQRINIRDVTFGYRNGFALRRVEFDGKSVASPFEKLDMQRVDHIRTMAAHNAALLHLLFDVFHRFAYHLGTQRVFAVLNVVNHDVIIGATYVNQIDKFHAEFYVTLIVAEVHHLHGIGRRSCRMFLYKLEFLILIDPREIEPQHRIGYK